jgi:hypothetical protein
VPVTLIVVAIALAIASQWWLSHRHRVAGRSPMEPAPATERILIPAELETASGSALGMPVAPRTNQANGTNGALSPAASAPAADASEAPASGVLAKAAVAGAQGASIAAQAVTDTFASLRVALDQLTGRVATLEAHDRGHDEQIAALRSDVDALKADRVTAAASAATAASGASARVSAGRVRRHVMAAARPAPSAVSAAASAAEAGTVLAVDLWGGRPSVALGRTVPGSEGTELRFFGEGETQGRVTVKRADPGSQTATFATPAGEFTLAPKAQ